MILQSIHAKNFRKYHRLDLKNIPTRGTVAIFGDNESGKSAIGETIIFAFFGQTFLSSSCKLEEVIHWNADACEAEVSFLADKLSYKVVRYLDRQGHHRCALYHDAKILANDPKSVARELQKITKLSFLDFYRAFFLAQKEVESTAKVPQNAREVLHDLLGFHILNDGTSELQKEIQKLEQNKAKCEQELLITKSMLDKIRLDSIAEREFSTVIEELNARKKELSNQCREKSKTLVDKEQILALQKGLLNKFEDFILSCKKNFYQDKINSDLEDLSSSYNTVLKKIDTLEKDQLQIQKDLDERCDRLKNIEGLEQEIASLEATTALYSEELRKQIVPSNTANLFSEIQEVENQTAKLGKTGMLFLLAAGGLFVLFFFLVILAILQSKVLFVCASLISLFGSLLSTIQVFHYREKLITSQQERSVLYSKQKEIEQEIEYCLNFPKKLSAIESFLKNLGQPSLENKFFLVSEKYRDLISKDINTLELKQNNKTHRGKLEESLKKNREQLEKLSYLRSILEDSMETLSMNVIESEAEVKVLMDEQKVVTLVKEIQSSSEFLEKNDKHASLEDAWDYFDECRNDFRSTSGISSIGGGVGMLNRIKKLFRHGHFDKFELDLQSEQDSFLSSLPSVDEQESEIQGIQKALDAAQAEIENIETTQTTKEESYQDFQSRFADKQTLKTKVHNLKESISQYEYKIHLNQVTTDAMEQTILAAEKKFIPSLSRMVSKILPRLTVGRYHHVQIEDDFSVRVFSNEKNDFIGTSQLSSSMANQLFLSLRLAFAKAVMFSKIGASEKQFLFFDQPTAHFDQKRNNAFFDLFTEDPQNFTQIFVIAPREFENLHRFDMVIHTDIAATTLTNEGIPDSTLKETTRRRYSQLPEDNGSSTNTE